MKNYIAYYRVSTQRQGRSGLGLDAQKEMVNTFTGNCKNCILAEYTEIESGKKANRPELMKAIDHAKKYGATLLVAKIDRLTRDLHFLTSLQNAGVKFTACDMPEANEMMIQIMVVFAQHERKVISKRTKDALKARVSRFLVFKGVNPDDYFQANTAQKKAIRERFADWPLGNDNTTHRLKEHHRKAGVQKIKDNARNNTKNNLAIKYTRDFIEKYKAENEDKMPTLQAIADHLNSRTYEDDSTGQIIPFRTRRGKEYKPNTVRRIIDKIPVFH